MRPYYNRRAEYSLEKKEPSSLSDLIPRVVNSMKYRAGLRDQIIMSAWDKVSGAEKYTLSKYVKGNVLFCTISSSVVRHQLFLQKEAIVKAMNDEMNGNSLLKGVDCSIKTLILK